MSFTDEFLGRFPYDASVARPSLEEVCRRVGGGYYSASKSARQAARAAVLDMHATVHAAAGGDLCTDDGTGTCTVCAVALGAPCEVCGGKGYHRDTCCDADDAWDDSADGRGAERCACCGRAGCDCQGDAQSDDEDEPTPACADCGRMERSKGCGMADGCEPLDDDAEVARG